MISITINGIDRTSVIQFNSFSKTDNLNNRVDSLTFVVLKYTGQTYKPSVNDEVVVYDGVTKIFGGVIISTDEEVEAHNILRINCNCKDYSHYLDRQLVLERFSDTTINDIIQTLIIAYAPGFTGTNVDAPIDVARVTFNRVTMSDVLNKLARLVNYSWYVDYDKDIHFFAKNEETAPYNITDTNEKHIFGTLSISSDFSQVRNRVTIRGGLEQGNIRTETFDGDGVKEFFRTANKFASLPQVMVNSVLQTVGVDFLDDETQFDAMWSYQEKYIRFTTGNEPPSGTDNVEITGIPLFPVIVQRSDSGSISQYGVYEYFEENKDLKTRDDALEFALAKIDAYKTSVIEGSFSTYEPGLRSGQVINVDSDLFGIDEDFIIQKVTTKLITNERPIYNVTLATLRTIGIISILQDLLRQKDVEEVNDEVLVSFEALEDDFAITDVAPVVTTQAPPYEWESDGGGVASPPGEYNLATWA